MKKPFFLATILIATICFSAIASAQECVDTTALANYILQWKTDSTVFPMPMLMQKIADWKSGAGCTTQTETWQPPIGIPFPEFGIEEQAPVYDVNNPLHYYVCRATSSRETCAPCNDYENEGRGSPTTPRCTIPGTLEKPPYPLPAGSLVEVHGQQDISYTSPIDFHGQGTAANPIFIRGMDSNHKPIFTQPFSVVGSSYVIMENIEFNETTNGGGFSVSDKDDLKFDSNHIALRHSDLHGYLIQNHMSGVSISGHGASIISNIVIYDNLIHNHGDLNDESDSDAHAISVAHKYGLGSVDNIWIVDNEMYGNSGDGIQIGDASCLANETRFIYVGRCISHGNKQSGLFTKTASDIIFSENIVYDHKNSGSADGPGLGLQYDTKRVWFLFNKAYNNSAGIETASSNEDTREDVYMIGNVLYGNTYGIRTRGGEEATEYIVGNTISNCSYGIFNGDYPSKLNILNNVLAGITNYHIFFERGETGVLSIINNALFDSPARINWDGVVRNLAQLQSATGKCLGCIEAEPQFINPAENDFRLQSSSPAIDNGTASGVYQTFYDLYGINISVDFDGNPRPVNGLWDIGAFEYH